MRFVRIPFGLKPASMMASLGLHLTAKDNLSNAPPHIVRAMTQNVMVDDLSWSSDNEAVAGLGAQQIRALGETSKLSFEKFDSNSLNVLKMIPRNLWAKNAGPTIDPVELKPPVFDNDAVFTSESKTKLLGTFWNKKDDSISLKITVHDGNKLTKRSSLSQQNSIYDLYGIGSAVTLIPKLLIQNMHKMGRFSRIWSI